MWTFQLCILFLVCHQCLCTEPSPPAPEKKPAKKKDIRDYNDADLEKLFDEWEDRDDPLEEDELPEHKRKPKPIDFDGVDMKDMEGIMQRAKHGKTLMAFVSVSGEPSQHELETLTQFWQSALYNGHIDTQRFVLDDNRVIFMFKDGSLAWKAKDYLVQQDRCLDVTIEGKVYPGKAAPKTEL